MATPTLALPGRPAAAAPLKQQLGRDDYIMRGALVALGALARRSPCCCRSGRCCRRASRPPTAASSGSPTSRPTSRNPALATSIGNRSGSRVAQHGDLRALAFAYAYGLTRTCMPARGLFRIDRADPDAGALAAAGDQPGLPVRQSGPGQGPAVRRLDLRADRHRHRRGVLDLPACADHHHHRTGDLRRAALRGGGGAARQSQPDLLDGDHPGRALRADQRGLRRLHPGDHRFRRAQGDRRPVQRAGDRHLQAGGRPAELPDGRRGRPDPAAAGGDRVRGRPGRCSDASRHCCPPGRCPTRPKPDARDRPADARRSAR